MNQIRMLLLILSTALLTLPLACQNNYSLNALPGPTATPTCSTPNFYLSCTSGINWNLGEIYISTYNSSTSYSISLPLAVNCAPYSTATVTLTGFGPPINIPYFGTLNVNGTTYSNYSTSGTTGSIPAGTTLTLTSVTASGTASASLVVPPYPVIASDGSTATWTGSGGQFNVAAVDNSSSTNTYESSLCWSASSPLHYPSSAYPSSGTYIVAAECLNYTFQISGGSGGFYIQNVNDQQVVK